MVTSDLWPDLWPLTLQSKEELQLMPQTVEEHMEELEGSDSEAGPDTTGNHDDNQDQDVEVEVGWRF